MRNRKLNYCFILLPLLYFSSCTSDQDKDGIPDKKDKCPNEFAKTETGCPNLEREIEKVHVYIENSASMAGYFERDAGFKTIVSDITAKVNQNIKPIDIWFIANTVQRYPGSAQQFSADMALENYADAKSSLLHEIIDSIANRNDSNDASLFVSDCILSFTNEQIVDMPNINQTEAPNALKNFIYSTFSKLKDSGFAASVYAFKSKFYTDPVRRIYYYDYRNGKHELNGAERPFYLWVIANKHLLPKFNAALANISTFKPDESLDFGLIEKSVNNYEIIPQLEKTENVKWKWNRSDSTIENINLEKGILRFCVALDLNSLPPYARQVRYLDSFLVVKASKCEVNIVVKDKTNIDKSKLRSDKQKEHFEQASHFIVFTLTAMNLPKASIDVSLPLRYNTWYEDWSYMDDTGTEATKAKTFAFKHLVDGVMEAYEIRNRNIISFSLHLKKD